MQNAAPIVHLRNDAFGVATVALAPLLYVYMPRPPVAGAHLLVFPMTAALLSAFVLLFLKRRPALDTRIIILILLLLVADIAAGVSFLINASEIRTLAILELFRPAVFAVYLVFGYFAARLWGDTQVRRGLLFAAYAILVGQLFIAASQIAGLAVFDLLYAADKTRPFGNLLRASGSLGNPNAFGWVVVQATAIIFALGGKHRHLWVLLGTILVVSSGSRTLLVLFPFVIVLARIGSQQKGLGSYFKGFLLSALGLVALLTFVIAFAQYLPYLSQLRNVLLSGSLASVNSFAARLDMWHSAYQLFTAQGIGGWFFGLGSREAIRTVDNDFLFVLVRLGGIGFLLHLSALVYIGRIFVLGRRHAAAAIGLEYLLFAMIVGFVSDTLGGWNYPLLLFFFAGLTTGLSRRQECIPTSSRRENPTDFPLTLRAG